MPPKNQSKAALNAQLMKACRDGDLDKVIQAVDNGADVNIKAPGNERPLYIAVKNKHKPVIDYLLTKGIHIEEKNGPYGRTALYKACFDGSLKIVKALVDAGANVNIKSTEGFTPLHIAVQNKRKPVVDYLLTKGARLDEKNGPSGVTALYIACVDGSLELLQTLVDAGANVNMKSTQGYTPLCVAVQKKHKSVVDYLLTKGVLLEEKNGPYGFTALYEACYDGSLEIVKSLVDAGANVNMKSTTGFAPLFVACDTMQTHVVEYLLTKGANIEEKNGLPENTALQKAAYVGSLDIVKILINAGANLNIIDKDGKSALNFAIENNQQEIVEYLESLQGPAPLWKGFTQSDISKFDTIFETEAPPGQVPPAVNYACCPVCLKFVERSDACMYMSHKCSGHYHTQLYNKYKNSEGLIYWCTICGRICFGHRHYPQAAWNAPKPELLPAGAPFEDDCKKTNGGGGLEEKLARFRMLRNTALDLQAAKDAGETLTASQAMNELVQQCWNTAPGFVTKRIMTKKAWNRPTTNFPPNAPPTAVTAFDYPKDDSSAYEVPRILNPGNANFGPNAYSFDDSEPVIQFKHKKADGTMHTHPLIAKDTLLGFLDGSGPEWPCFDPACGGHLWPAEVIQALENPALAATPEEKAKAQAYKVRVHGPAQHAGRRKTRQKERKETHRIKS